MIYKVLYHESEQDNPRREYTEAIYVESDSSINVREQVENNTEYNIEYIQALDEKHLEYEKNSPNFKLTEF
ncbi:MULTISPECIES: DNA-directed RNA polymerase subunit epsilon [Lactobacillaceae]|uniref:DNA-directed RNA polymerase subunit epsilon n=1 Tax=Lactobacillaceae TaxID=33958 RepID=UPI000C1B76AF|nr:MULTISPECIES: DNA-directed RNA polymerase subunit epsilon [Lactobacillaceae]